MVPSPNYEASRKSVDNALKLSAKRAEELAAGWIERHLVCFNPLLQPDPRRTQLSTKAASELALLCSIALRDVGSNGMHQYREWAHYLWSKVMSVEAFQDYLIANASGLPAFGLYASLRECGYEDERLRARLKELLDAGYVLFSERPPAVQLDLLHSIELGSFDHDECALEDVYERTLLSSCPSLYPLTSLDVYAITHTVFFLSDFGRRQPKVMLEKVRVYCRSAIPRLLEYYLWKKNWDLVGELLIVMKELSIEKGSATGEAWTLFLKAQEGDGSVCGPREASDEDYRELHRMRAETDASGGRDEEWKAFVERYHTTLVALLAIQTCFQGRNYAVARNWRGIR